MTIELPDNGVQPARVFGIVVHAGRHDARAAAIAAATSLRRAGLRVVGCKQEDWPPTDVFDVVPPDSFAAEIDVALVFGGDGTFLRAAYLTRDGGVPLLGVNLGRLGFLSECELHEVPEALDRLIAGDYHVEDRMTLTASVFDASGRLTAQSWALNDASVERRDPQRLIVLDVAIGSTQLTRIPADALICASPTGSTAYAFSAGGPILSPQVEALVLVPVAAHSLFNRTIVVDPNDLISIRPEANHNPCVVSMDGRESLAVPPHGEVQVTRGHVSVRMIRLRPFDFYDLIREKFGLR
ncbi:MAG TPA: NAD(+)/NADH kinase [Euzebyales bacterium]|nr:NAD(+)/NADH kinase [Euzebyales bacterium]